MSKMIDLGRAYDACAPCCDSTPQKGSEKRISYPTLYISGIKGLDLSTGEITFTAKGKVVSVSERESIRDGKETEEYSCEIEVHAISTEGKDSSGGLKKTLDEIASKKGKEEDDE